MYVPSMMYFYDCIIMDLESVNEHYIIHLNSYQSQLNLITLDH